MRRFWWISTYYSCFQKESRGLSASSQFWGLCDSELCLSEYLLVCHPPQCGDWPVWSSSRKGVENKWWNHPYDSLDNQWVEEGSLGMVTTFCCHYQAKVESLAVLTTLCKQDSPKLSIVVVKIFANFPYLPQGSSSYLYLDVTTLLLGTLTAQFPLDQLCLWQLLPYSPNKSSCHVKQKAKI